jgi:hypothetical protein
MLGVSSKSLITHSNTILKVSQLHSNRFLWTGNAVHIRGRTKISTFLCDPLIDLYQARKSYWSWNNRKIGIKNSFNEPVGNKEGRHRIWKLSPVNIFFPYICFHLTAWKMANTTAHLQSSITRKDSYVDLERSIFVKTQYLKFYLVTYSLFRWLIMITKTFFASALI